MGKEFTTRELSNWLNRTSNKIDMNKKGPYSLWLGQWRFLQVRRYTSHFFSHSNFSISINVGEESYLYLSCFPSMVDCVEEIVVYLFYQRYPPPFGGVSGLVLWVKGTIQACHSTINDVFVKWEQLFNAEVVVAEFRRYIPWFVGCTSPLSSAMY